MNKKKIFYSITCVYFIVVIIASNFFPYERAISINRQFNRCFGKVIDRFELTREEAKKLENNTYFTMCNNSAYDDQIEYMAIAIGKDSKEPFSLRPLLPKLIGSLASFFGTFEDNKIKFLRSIFLVNKFLTISLLSIGLLAIYLAISNLTSNNYLRLTLPSIFVINIGVLQTGSFLMLDIASYCIGAICIFFTSKKNFYGLALAIMIGILIKEVLIIYSLCFLLLFYQNRGISLDQLLLSISPFLLFTGFRVFSDVDPLSLQYGWNISEGQIKLKYINYHLRNFAIPFLLKVSSALGFPLLIFLSYYKNFKNHKFYIFMFIFMIISIILANLLLASRVPRVVFVVYPFLAFIIASISPSKNIDQTKIE